MDTPSRLRVPVMLVVVACALALTGSMCSRSAFAQEAQEEARDGTYLSNPVVDARGYAGVRGRASALQRVSSRDASLKTLDQETFTYYLPASANSNGAFGSVWRTLLQGRNHGNTTATVYMTAHPRGVPAGELDPVAQPLSLGPAVSFDFHNVLGEQFNYNGAAWIEIESDQPLSFEQSNTYNRSSEGARQGTAYPVLDAATIATDQRILHRGDMVEYRLLGEENGKRENWILFNPPGSQELIARLKLLDSNGSVKAENWYVIPAETYWQASPVGTALNGDPNTVNPGDSLQITIDRSTPGEGDVLAYSIISQVDTVNQEKQDPITLEGKIYRLVEEAEYRWTPSPAEVNDTIVKRLHIKAGEGVIIGSLGEDVDGNGTYDNTWDPDTNEFTYEFVDSPVAAGAWNPTMRAFFIKNGVAYNRDFPGNTINVNPESNGYIASYDDAKAFIMGNLDLASAWSSHGLIGGYAAKPSEWRTSWPIMFDGINNPPDNPEVSYFRFDDVGSTLAGNNLVIFQQDGTIATIAGMPEAEFDQFRQATKAVKP